MRVAVIGAGYVGLVQAAGLAELGHQVRVGEADPQRLETLQAGRSPIIEPDLEEVIAGRLASGHLSFHGDNLAAVAGAEVVFIAVPTPPLDDGSADLRILRSVLTEIVPGLAVGTVVTIKSTVPVGTLDMIADQYGTDALGLSLASNPEFLREGSALADFRHPDRVVIGSRDEHAAAVLHKLYEPMAAAPILVMDPVAAELVKYGSNAYLALRVTFANSLANLCEVVDADVAAVLEGMGYDPRIGSHFLKPGPGFGGTCLPKDASALVWSAADAGYTFSLLEAVIAENEEQRRRVVAKVRNALGDLDGRRIALWGMAFKAGTSDTRESPALQVGHLIAEEGAVIRAYDPAVEGPIDGWEMAASALDAAADADALVIVTEWPEFGHVDLAALAEAMAGDAVIDARNILDPTEVRSHQLRYWGIGR